MINVKNGSNKQQFENGREANYGDHGGHFQRTPITFVIEPFESGKWNQMQSNERKISHDPVRLEIFHRQGLSGLAAIHVLLASIVPSHCRLFCVPFGHNLSCSQITQQSADRTLSRSVQLSCHSKTVYSTHILVCIDFYFLCTA